MHIVSEHDNHTSNSTMAVPARLDQGEQCSTPLVRVAIKGHRLEVVLVSQSSRPFVSSKRYRVFCVSYPSHTSVPLVHTNSVVCKNHAIVVTVVVVSLISLDTRTPALIRVHCTRVTQIYRTLVTLVSVVTLCDTLNNAA